MSDGPAIALLATGSSEPCVDDASSFEAAVRARCAATGSSEPCVLDVGPLTSLRYAQGTLDLVRADLCAHLPPAAADAALAACARARVADAFALRRELVALKKVYFNLVIDGGALDKDLRQVRAPWVRLAGWDGTSATRLHLRGSRLFAWRLRPRSILRRNDALPRPHHTTRSALAPRRGIAQIYAPRGATADLFPPRADAMWERAVRARARAPPRERGARDVRRARDGCERRAEAHEGT